MLTQRQKIAVAAMLIAALALSPPVAAAGERNPSDALSWTGDIEIVTTMLTRVSAVEQVVSVELFPREIRAHPGDAVVWLNAVPGAMMQVVFDSTPSAVRDCSPTSPVRRPDSVPLMPGEASLLCFLASGTYPYHAMIGTAEATITLEGVVVVTQ